ncbi:threonine-phosphate decarboxylase [Pseudooceanicola aestuarii]|uniref:threonine-phosphate decarboxylase n=1 Tax=Pseudooceanicola aestuarii TaxID=2697319 RepID=UPI0013D27A60|nr:threonine-phosphate decarboxylase [Pseudooceanicola aestuarii]
MITGARPLDHGGNLDAAIAHHGGTRGDWIDLSTGINPVPYPIARLLTDLPAATWQALPDRHLTRALIASARRRWDVPRGVEILPVPGASAAIAQIPRLTPAGRVHIPGPTYNEHAASFAAAGWTVDAETTPTAPVQAQVLVHPNNPDGRFHPAPAAGPLTVIDESFGDIAPTRSHVALTTRPDTLILKSFGKFWGLAGLRLGFVIAQGAVTERLAAMLGPWPVSGPALVLGRAALEDDGWATCARDSLLADTARLDGLADAAGLRLAGGTPLFRLYETAPRPALEVQARLARHRIWSRVFPYNRHWLRLGLPPAHGWARLEAALT